MHASWPYTNAVFVLSIAPLVSQIESVVFGASSSTGNFLLSRTNFFFFFRSLSEEEEKRLRRRRDCLRVLPVCNAAACRRKERQTSAQGFYLGFNVLAKF
jgi:hypothetical protein